jgi:tight adherence protein B
MITTIMLLLLGSLVVAIAGVVVLAEASAQRHLVASLVTGGEVRSGFHSLRSRVDARLRRTKFGHHLQRRLEGARVGLAVIDCVVLVGAAALAVAVLSYPFLGRIGGLLAAGAVVFAAHRWLQRAVQRRVDAFVGQLPEVARVLSNAASAGLALRTALAMAGDELDEPAGGELRAVTHAMAVGQSLDQALAAMQERLPSRELAVLVQTLIIQHRSGGALVTALSNMATTLEQRKELRREVKTVVAGAVFGGHVVTLLGVGSVFFMNLISPGALDVMAGTAIGRLVLIAAAALFGVGYVLIRRLTSIEV